MAKKFQKDVFTGNYEFDYVDNYIGATIKGYDPHMRVKVTIEKIKGGYTYILYNEKTGYKYESKYCEEPYKSQIDAAFEAGRHIEQLEREHSEERRKFLVSR